MGVVVELLSALAKVTVLWIQTILQALFPPPPKSLEGQVVLVTGAGRGIGRELALEIHRVAPSAVLVLWDINEENNDATKSMLEERGCKVVAYVCDVSKRDVVRSVAERMSREVGEVDVLVNNAGVVRTGHLLDLEDSDILRTFNVNVLAQFWTVREFLPAMMKKKRGHIVNVASMSAKSATALIVDYSASKYAVYGLTEGLREELDSLGVPDIKTTVVCPLFVDTELLEVSRQRISTLLTPQEVAKATIAGVVRNREHVFVPGYLYYLVKLQQLLPLSIVKYLKSCDNIQIVPQCQRKNN